MLEISVFWVFDVLCLNLASGVLFLKVFIVFVARCDNVFGVLLDAVRINTNPLTKLTYR